MNYGICQNCGAAAGLHHHATSQCPKNGIEETRYDRLEGKYYPQQWEETVFEEECEKSIIVAVPLMLEALQAAKAQLEYHIEFASGSGGEAKVLEKIEIALKEAGIE